jgi:hypothetical protein
MNHEVIALLALPVVMCVLFLAVVIFKGNRKQKEETFEPHAGKTLGL